MSTVTIDQDGWTSTMYQRSRCRGEHMEAQILHRFRHFLNSSTHRRRRRHEVRILLLTRACSPPVARLRLGVEEAYW
jgi:hypothetical protein